MLNVEVLRDIRKRFLQAVNRAESLSMDIRNDRTLLSEIEEDISLAIKKAGATTQLNNAREDALKCGHELEALTRARKKLVSAIEKINDGYGGSTSKIVLNIYDQNKNSYCESIANLLVQKEK